MSLNDKMRAAGARRAGGRDTRDGRATAPVSHAGSDAHGEPGAGMPPRRPHGMGMGHGPGMGMAGVKAKDFKGTSKRLLSFMGRFKAPFAVAIAFAVGSTVFSIIGPKVLSQATTELFEGMAAKIAGTGGIDFGAVGGILLATLALYAVSAACSFVQGWTMSSVSQRMCYQLRREIAEKIDRVPMGYFESTSVGDTLSRITNDVDSLGQSLNQGVTQLITSSATIVGVLVMMLTINPLMTLVTLVIVPVSLVLVGVIVKRSQKYFRQQQAMLGAINGQVEETFSGQNVVRAFCQEGRAVAAFGQANERLYEAGWKSQFLSGLMMPVMNFVSNAGYVAVAVLGSVFAARGVITVGDIQAFIQYVKNFTQPITQLAQVSNILQLMAASAERVFEFLDAPEEASEQPRATTDGVRCDVEFDHVSFGYTPDKTVIRDFSASVREGQTVAHRGPHRRRQDHDGEAAHALLRRERGRHTHRRPRRARLRPQRPAQPVRHGAAGHVAVQGDHPREHPLRQARRHRQGGRAPRRRRPTRTTSSARCRTATTPRSTKTRATSARASASCSPSRAPSSPTGACSSSTRRPRAWTRAPRSASRRPWTT